MHDDLVDLDLVQGSIISVDWLALHQIQSLKPVNDLA